MVEKNYLDVVYENLGLKSGDYTHLLAKYIVKNIIKLKFHIDAHDKVPNTE